MRTAIAILAVAVATACGDGGTPPCDITVGPWGDEMPDLEMHVGDTVETDLRDHFGPKGCLDHHSWDGYWLIRSADPSAVAVARTETVLETAALAVADSVRVTVGLTVLVDHRFEDNPPHEFLVRVRPR